MRFDHKPTMRNELSAGGYDANEEILSDPVHVTTLNSPFFSLRDGGIMTGLLEERNLQQQQTWWSWQHGSNNEKDSVTSETSLIRLLRRVVSNSIQRGFSSLNGITGGATYFEQPSVLIAPKPSSCSHLLSSLAWQMVLDREFLFLFCHSCSMSDKPSACL